MLLFNRRPRAVEQGLIFLEFQCLAGEAVQHLIGLDALLGAGQTSQHRIGQRLRQIIGVAVGRLDLDIGIVRINAKSHVAGQCPGRCGPGQEIGILTDDAEAYDGGAFLYGLIALRHLLRGQRGAAARAVRYDFKALVQQALVPDFLQRPPFGFDKVIIVGNIGMLHVRPKADRAGEVLPHALVLPNAFLALIDKRLQAVGFDLILAIQAEQLFHLDLDRQTVRIPTGFAGNHIALHRAVAGNHILNNTGQHMTDMRLAVGCRGTVIKREGRTALAVLHAFFKNVVVLPESKNFFFALRKVHIRRYFLVHRFAPPFFCNKNPCSVMLQGRSKSAVPP